MSTCAVSGTFTDGGGNAIESATVRFNTDSPAFDSSGNLVMPSEITTTTATNGTWTLNIDQGISGFLTLDLPPSSTGPVVKYKFSMVIPSTSTATLAQCWAESSTFGGQVPTPLSWGNIQPPASGDISITSEGVFTLVGVSTANVIPLSALVQIPEGYVLGSYGLGTENNVSPISPSTLVSILPLVNDFEQGVVPQLPNSTTEFFRGDGTWASPVSTSRSISNVSSNTNAGSASSTDYIYNCSGTMTLTLPTAVSNTNLYTVKNTGTGTISIATTSSQTIDGTASPIQIKVQNVSLSLESDGSNWRLV